MGGIPTLSRLVERNFLKLLDLADKHRTSTTCFFLGWIAERFPHLVREAYSRGHEIASHGYAHRLIYGLSPAEFRADAERARMILEDVAGCDVLGFRAPGFSVTKETPWFFEELAKSGYRYDSSIFPARRGHGGIEAAARDPFVVDTTPGYPTVEFPITVVGNLYPICLFGGGYLRLLPWPLIRSMATRCLRNERTVVFYVHPREVDVDHPRMSMNWRRRFKSYVNLETTEHKIAQVLETFRCGSFRDTFAEMLTVTPIAEDVRAVAAGANGAR